MIKHLVMFTLADNAEGRTKIENALVIKQKLEALKDAIPQIRKMEVFINGDDAPAGNHDIVLDSEFDTMDDVKIYAAHPAHVEVSQFIGKVRTGRAAIDYEFY